MSILRILLRYVGYSILIMLLLFSFAESVIRDMLITLCGAALSISMFAAVFQLLLGGSAGAIAQSISAWLLRGTAVIAAIVVITEIGIGKIIRLFIYK